MKWFTNPGTLEELKKQYKKLAMKHHPDIGGKDADMKEINLKKEVYTRSNYFENVTCTKLV